MKTSNMDILTRLKLQRSYLLKMKRKVNDSDSPNFELMDRIESELDETEELIKEYLGEE